MLTRVSDHELTNLGGRTQSAALQASIASASIPGNAIMIAGSRAKCTCQSEPLPTRLMCCASAVCVVPCSSMVRCSAAMWICPVESQTRVCDTPRRTTGFPVCGLPVLDHRTRRSPSKQETQKQRSTGPRTPRQGCGRLNQAKGCHHSAISTVRLRHEQRPRSAYKSQKRRSLLRRPQQASNSWPTC